MNSNTTEQIKRKTTSTQELTRLLHCICVHLLFKLMSEMQHALRHILHTIIVIQLLILIQGLQRFLKTFYQHLPGIMTALAMLIIL